MSEPANLLPLPESDLRMMEHAVARYQGAIGDARSFLEARGITEATAATFRLGVVNDPIPEHERYRGMLCIPYLNPSGRVVQTRFRCLADHKCSEFKHGKYQTVSGDKGRMFNTPALVSDVNELHICEGEMDAIILSQAGFSAVGMPGASTWRDHHRVMCAGYEWVFIWGDGDEAGREFAQSVRSSLRGSVIIRVPDGMDVNDLYLQRGTEGLTGLLEDARELHS